MRAQLHAKREVIKIYEQFGDQVFANPSAFARSPACSNFNMGDRMAVETMKREIEELEELIGDTADTLEDGEDFMILPHEILEASYRNRIGIVTDWLGPNPEKRRVDAKDPTRMHNTLLQAAMVEGHVDLMCILLQYGAEVDPENSFGDTPLVCSVDKPVLEAATRLLMEWGADSTRMQTNMAGFKSDLPTVALMYGNKRIAALLKSELGGRRCEIFGMESRKDLNGLTGVCEKYLPEKDRYKVVVEKTSEEFLVSSKKLKRRDRTPDDCGYYIGFEGRGRIVRTVFPSAEDCKAFQEKLAKASKVADTHSAPGKKGGGKKKGKKKRGKKK